MPDFLKDPNWLDVIIGFIALVVGSAITIFIFLHEYKKKLLTYYIRHSSSIMFVEDSITPGIRITYKGKLVQNIYLQEYELHNNGNTPIVPTDFEKPLRLRFNNQPQIFSVEVIKTKPTELNPHIAITQNDIIFEPLLLNPGDRILVQVILDADVKGSIDSRIIGIGQILNGEERIEFPNNVFNISIIAIVVCSMIIMRDSVLHYGEYMKYSWAFIEPSLSSTLSLVAIYTTCFFLLLAVVSGGALIKHRISNRGF